MPNRLCDVRAVGVADLAPAPAGFVRGLADHEGGRDAGGAPRRACAACGVLLHEAGCAAGRRMRGVRCGRGVAAAGWPLGAGIGAAAPGPSGARAGARWPRTGRRAGRSSGWRTACRAARCRACCLRCRACRELSVACAHALHQLLHEQRLELLGRLLDRRLRVARAARAARRSDCDVGGEADRRRASSDHLDLGIQRAGALHRLQDRQQVLRRRAERVQRLDHVGQLARRPASAACAVLPA